MRKSRIKAALLSGMILLGFAGCAIQDVKDTEISTHSNSTDITVESEIQSSDVFDSKAADASTTDQKVKPVSEPVEETSNAPGSGHSVNTSKKELQSNKSSQVKNNVEDKTKHTNPSNTTTTKKQEEAKPTKPTEAEFDINKWISFAKNYAVSIGLQLDRTATACWDNPINANSKCIYLERDIKGRLDFYARQEDITAVWVWAEEISPGSYQLYIGYA